MNSKALFLVISGIFIFISTFLRSYLNGDDVVHFSEMVTKKIYFPNFTNSWIPNRVFDQYFRTLDVNLFDFFYFFSKKPFPY
jgi:hypothetical protein